VQKQFSPMEVLHSTTPLSGYAELSVLRLCRCTIFIDLTELCYTIASMAL